MKRLILALVLLAIAAFAVFAMPNPEYRLICQKLATELVMPYALVAVGLLCLTILVWRNDQSWLRWALGGLFVLHLAGGNGLISQYLLLSLERPYQKQRTYELEPFDAIVVLGGGTDEARNGFAESGESGDRVVVAARAYHAGLTKKIICTGDRIELISKDKMSPAEEAFEILVGLGVPDQHVHRLGGVNTIAEMKNLKKILDPNQRIGLITSAWHMPRAIRLSKTQGLDFVPLPADFRTDNPITLSPFELIPDANDSADIQIAVKEYLAKLVGR